MTRRYSSYGWKFDIYGKHKTNRVASKRYMCKRYHWSKEFIKYIIAQGAPHKNYRFNLLELSQWFHERFCYNLLFSEKQERFRQRSDEARRFKELLAKVKKEP